MQNRRRPFFILLFRRAAAGRGSYRLIRSFRGKKETIMDQCCGFPYFDPEFDSLMECIPPPSVCVDNETCPDCTLVKVDSANRHGMLLEMVQVLTDLDLIMSKSYVSSDGGWLMDVFHVTDQLGNKLTDDALIRYIQQSLVSHRKGGSERPAEVKTCLGNLIGAGHLASDCAALEITASDRPGLLSEVTAVLTQLFCDVDSGVVWTHNGRAACIIYITESSTGLPISDAARLADVEEKVESVVVAHHFPGESRRVCLSGPTTSRVHTERRLHQLLQEDKDYEAGPPPPPVEGDYLSMAIAAMEGKRWLGGGCGVDGEACAAQVSIDSWKERDYSVVNVRSRDRPKLMFDTVCMLTDLEYDVFHASISAYGSLAVQEYYVRRMDGCMLDTELERRRVVRCLVAAVERRISHGTRVEMRTSDRHGLIAHMTRSFRENGLSLTRAEWAKQGDSAVGTFYIADASTSSCGGDVGIHRLEAVRNEIGGGIFFEVNDDSSNNGGARRGWLTPSSYGSSRSPTPPAGVGMWSWGKEERAAPKMSLGSLVWSGIERFSSNFGSIRS